MEFGIKYWWAAEPRHWLIYCFETTIGRFRFWMIRLGGLNFRPGNWRNRKKLWSLSRHLFEKIGQFSGFSFSPRSIQWRLQWGSFKHCATLAHRCQVVRESDSMATQLWNLPYSNCCQGLRYARKVSGEGQIIIEQSFLDTFGNFEVQPEGNRKHLVRLTASGISLTWVIQQFWNISWPHRNGDLI